MLVQVITNEDLGYHENWKDVPNMFGDETSPGITWRTDLGMQCGANGKFTVAYWCTEADEVLSYQLVDLATTEEDVECVGDQQHDTMDERRGNDL